MKRVYVRWVSFLVAAALFAGYGAWRIYANVSGGAGRNRISFELSLEPGESVVGAAAGHLANIAYADLVIGTWTIEGRGRVHILHRKRDRYELVWSSTGSYGNFARASIHLTGRGQPVLITEWTNGNHAFLDVAVFKWDGRAYQEIWRLEPFTESGQLTQEANLEVQRFDESGDIQLVVRTPLPKSGEHALEPLPHQVSIYRWDNKAGTFVFFKRLVDPQRSWE
jgi:hypothetical protein